MESESAVPHIQIFWQFEEYYKTLLFTPMSITPLIGMEDARIVLNVSRPSPKGDFKWRDTLLFTGYL